MTAPPPEDLSELARMQHTASPAPTPDDLPEDTLRRRPARRLARRRRALIAAALALTAALAGGAAAWAVAANEQRAEEATETPDPPVRSAPAPMPEPTTEPTSAPEPTPEPAPAPAPAPQPNLDDPNSITVVVNKQRPLQPAEWGPADLVMPQGIPNTNGQPLRAEAASALQQMYQSATAAGVPFIITSAYRDYWLQTSLFNNYAARDGVAAAETYSARPGHSEHQTGLAADLDDGSGCAFMSCFGETATGLWLRENAYQFGFILRYDNGQQPVVGYIYEPWHFRYVGVEIATDMRAKGIINLEEYFGLPAAPGY
ncbi:M15 family metallopeptidase [Leucobacter sp. W1153]|uniref:M15 family metallopeptidase n=1 Tax=unclassified Leucobacter TaxID=2621730 RepID=UPI003F2B3021